MQITRYIWLLTFWVLWSPLRAQTAPDTPASPADSLLSDLSLENQMAFFLDEITTLEASGNIQIYLVDGEPISSYYIGMMRESLQQASSTLQAFDIRWTAFTQNNQKDINDNEDLMEHVVEIQQIRQAAADTIAAKGLQCQALSDFAEAEALINHQDSTYRRLYSTAVKMSLIQKFTPQLEQLKAQEQLLFTKLQTSYEKAKAAVALIPILKPRMAALDEHFANIKTVSTQIQATVYQPFFQRIKDYLLGLACVAIIFMFFNMLLTKFQAAKKMRDNLKKYQELMNKNGMGDYPTI